MGATRTALWLVGVTLAYNVIEAVVALWSGAEAESIALLGFGFDSVIECAAAIVLFWRLSTEARGASAEAVEATERRVHRFVGVTFIVAGVLLRNRFLTVSVILSFAGVGCVLLTLAFRE